MDRRAAVAVAGGGAVGAALRWWLLGAVVADGPFPWPVLGVNALGSLALGLAVGLQHRGEVRHLLLRDFVGIGVCGGFTTFSTFAVDVAALARAGDHAVALAYAGASVAVAVAAVVAGVALVGRVVDLTAPLEAEP